MSRCRSDEGRPATFTGRGDGTTVAQRAVERKESPAKSGAASGRAAVREVEPAAPHGRGANPVLPVSPPAPFPPAPPQERSPFFDQRSNIRRTKEREMRAAIAGLATGGKRKKGRGKQRRGSKVTEKVRRLLARSKAQKSTSGSLASQRPLRSSNSAEGMP